MRHRNGHEIPAMKNANIVRDEEGKTTGIVETGTNLTQLNEARREVEEAAHRLREIHRMGNATGKSNGMQRAYAAIRAAASLQPNPKDAPAWQDMHL